MERIIGLLFRLLIVGAVFALVLYWGRIAALVGSVVAALVMLPMGMAAFSWYGAVGGLALAARLPAASSPANGAPLVAGGVCGLARPG